MKKKITDFAVDILLYIVGGAIYSSAVTMLVSANEISPGGITGIATAVNYLTGIPSGLILFVLNVPILILGFIKLGGMFIIKTAVATTILSVSMELTETFLPAFKTDKILACVFGGIIMGAGLSIVLMRGATTGGVDIIAKLINRKFRHLTVGRLILFMDAFVIAVATVTYRNIESALYSVISMYASSRVMDTLLYGADKGKIIYIVTSFPDDICKQIDERMHRGVTRINAVGGYTGENRTMLMCTVRRHEVSAIYSIIKECDEKAFTVVGEAGEIIGEGFKSIG